MAPIRHKMVKKTFGEVFAKSEWPTTLTSLKSSTISAARWIFFECAGDTLHYQQRTNDNICTYYQVPMNGALRRSIPGCMISVKA